MKYRLLRRNVVIKKGLRVYSRLDIRGDGKVVIGEHCSMCGISGDRNQYVTIYTHAPDATITIGDNVQLVAARFSSKFSISVGNGVLIEEASILDTDFHSVDRNRGEPTNESYDKCKVVIGNNVLIGARSIITKGIRIGDNAIVGAGSIVTTRVPSGVFVLGNPAKVIRAKNS